jgi:hypothetical protein
VTQRASLRFFGVLLVLALSVSVLTGAVAVQAQSMPGAGWSPAAGAVGDNTYEGFIDQPVSGATIAAGASFTVSGWVVDTTAEGWSGIDGVQVMLGSNVLANLAVGVSRPDVAAALNNPFYGNSGFNGVVASALPTGAQTLTVVAHTPNKGSWSKSVQVNVSGSAGPVVTTGTGTTGIVLRIISPTADDLVLPNNNGTINGTAYDTRTRAELGVGVDRVSLYLNGARGTAGSQFLGDAVQNGTNWSLAWEPTKYDGVQHNILWVYAHSSVTGEEALLQQDLFFARP